MTVEDRPGVAHLAGWGDVPQLRLLNLLYDATPSDYVTMIITEACPKPLRARGQGQAARRRRRARAGAHRWACCRRRACPLCCASTARTRC